MPPPPWTPSQVRERCLPSPSSPPSQVHERSMHGDFLAALLKGLLVERRRSQGTGGGPAGRGQGLPPLKVVLMSATLDAAMFARYFGGCPGEKKWSR